MTTRTPIEIGEWYHCFNRGVDKRRIFTSDVDYKRFLTLLYICNGTHNIRIAERYNSSFDSILSDTSLNRGKPLVEIGAYALMPNHLHILCREVREGGIATFMQKVFTGYTMYFNRKYTRTGSLLSGTFKSRHVGDDAYFKQVVAYVLLNPAELFDPQWKEGMGDIKRITDKLLQYSYSSLSDFLGEQRLQGGIVSDLSDHYDKKPSLENMARVAQEYYKDNLSPKV